MLAIPEDWFAELKAVFTYGSGQQGFRNANHPSEKLRPRLVILAR